MDIRKLIVIPVFNKSRFIDNNLTALKDLQTDVLLLDDGSTDNTYSIIRDHRWVKYIKHELQLGTGASFTTGYEYARDMDYDYIILFDNFNVSFREELDQMKDNITYGFDIINCSRILENYNHSTILPEHISITGKISDNIKTLTGLDLTDPLSGIKAVRVDALKNMELTDTTHGLFLQLFIQAHYFGLTIIEIPAISGNGFGHELELYNDPLGYFLTLIETEKYLYPDKNVH